MQPLCFERHSFLWSLIPLNKQTLDQLLYARYSAGSSGSEYALVTLSGIALRGVI